MKGVGITLVYFESLILITQFLFIKKKKKTHFL